MRFRDLKNFLFGKNKNSAENDAGEETNKRALLLGSTRVVKPGRIDNRELRRLAAKTAKGGLANMETRVLAVVLYQMRQAGIVQRAQRRISPKSVLAFLRAGTKTGEAA